MIILGIDPSYTATGYAIIKKQNTSNILLQYGFLPLPTTLAMQERIGKFFDFFEKIIIQFQITHIILETPFLGKNAQTFLKLGYLRGALHVLAYRHHKKLLEFSPREVKMAVTGFGGAQKDQVSRMIHILYPGLTVKKQYDITDAIAVGLCGIWRV